MKKTIKTLAAVLCCALAFTACTKDQLNNGGQENNDNPVDDGTIQVDQATVSYRFQTTEALLQYFDFTFEYIESTTGAKRSEKITVTDFQKEISNAKLPLNMGYKLTTTLKAGKTIEEVRALDKVDYILPSPSCWIYMYDKKGNLVGEGGRRVSVSGSVNQTGARVAQRFEEGSFNKSYFESVDATGSGTTGTWE
jgi:hypothetical protein